MITLHQYHILINCLILNLKSIIYIICLVSVLCRSTDWSSCFRVSRYCSCCAGGGSSIRGTIRKQLQCTRCKSRGGRPSCGGPCSCRPIRCRTCTSSLLSATCLCPCSRRSVCLLRTFGSCQIRTPGVHLICN